MATVVDIPETSFQHTAFPPMPVSRLPVAGYEEWIRAGIITEDDQIELLDGWIVPKMTKNSPHVAACLSLNRRLSRVVPDAWCVSCQDPVRLSTSMPEPDFMVLRGDERRYFTRLPQAGDVELVVEIADASLAVDRGIKKTIYAQAGISCYWLINLVERQIEVYSDPTGSGETADYRERHDYFSDDEIPIVLDGNRVAALVVRDLLP